MQRTMLKSKIHRVRVTQADLHYVGSCTIDADLMDAADLLEGEQIDIVDIDNGARITTYAIAGERGTGVIGINGAAAHLVHPGDLVIIISYGIMEDAEARSFSPRVIFVDEENSAVISDDDPGHAPEGSGLKDPRNRDGSGDARRVDLGRDEARRTVDEAHRAVDQSHHAVGEARRNVGERDRNGVASLV